jgi:hypothetical protein
VVGHEAFKEAGIDLKDLNTLPKTLSQIKNGGYAVDEKSYQEFLKKYSSQTINTENPDEIAAELKEAVLWYLKRD